VAINAHAAQTIAKNMLRHGIFNWIFISQILLLAMVSLPVNDLFEGSGKFGFQFRFVVSVLLERQRRMAGTASGAKPQRKTAGQRRTLPTLGAARSAWWDYAIWADTHACCIACRRRDAAVAWGRRRLFAHGTSEFIPNIDRKTERDLDGLTGLSKGRRHDNRSGRMARTTAP
jgi:hypothetical protein